MRIHNIRLGFATNSSSTHSLVFIRGKKAQDYDVGQQDFGWNYFTAASEEAKKDYLAQTLYENLTGMVHADIAKAVVAQWVGVELKDGGYVDHQSRLALPRTLDGKGVDKEFFEAFRDFMLQKDVAILGGNDNDGVSHPLRSESTEINILPVEDLGPIARKDPKYNFWTLFNSRTGAKVRVSFDHLTRGEEFKLTRASLPELVDVKITDYCPFNCEYCYQGSTPTAAHGDIDTIRAILYSLQELKVFEVAFGGGEPTMHPQFAQILDETRRLNMIPNFTTKSLAWFKDEEIVKAVKQCGGFAFSVTKASEITELLAALEKAELGPAYGRPPRVNVQYVMGSTPLDELKEILKACFENSLTPVLLGYKTTGRGADFKPNDYADWYTTVVEAIGERSWCTVGIDTALALEVDNNPIIKGQLLCEMMTDRARANPFYTTQEGKFSMYIDAVTKKMGPSSYCEPLRMKALPPRWENKKILTAFQSW